MEDVLTEDQSHYEVSLTAGQAFMAFVLLLLSLAAAFAFGLVIGKGEADEKLVTHKETPAAVITEPVVAREEFKAPPAERAPAPVAIQPVQPVQAQPSQPAYAQVLSSSDQKIAEGLAEKLIGAGFTTAYVERSTTDKGQIYRVRIKFDSEQEARAAEAKLKEFSKDVWITK